jgi:copper chaperone CopZ
MNEACLEGTNEMIASVKHTVILKVEGMTCGHCVARVQKALDAAPGVDTARVDLQSGTTEVRFGAETDPATLIGVIEASGYTARVA